MSDDTPKTSKMVTVFSPTGGGRCLVPTPRLRVVVQAHDQKIRMQQLYVEPGSPYAEWQDIDTVVEAFPGQIPSRVPFR